MPRASGDRCEDPARAKDGLKELGFEEGRQYVLHIRDVKGDPKALEPAARTLEQEKVDLIYSLSTSIALAVRRATTSVPIVFYAGIDPWFAPRSGGAGSGANLYIDGETGRQHDVKAAAEHDPDLGRPNDALRIDEEAGGRSVTGLD